MKKKDGKKPRSEDAPASWLRGGAGPHKAKKPYNRKRERRGNKVSPDEYEDND